MKKGLIYSLAVIIGIIVVALCSFSVFAETEKETESRTTGVLYRNVMQLKQPDENHVYFGSYPQTEIVDKAEHCGTYGKKWCLETDYIIDITLYSALQNADWDSNGDTTIDENKYHRILKTNAIYSKSDDARYYDWEDSITYHYFKYEPVKWKILKITDNDAFILSECAIDTRKYEPRYGSSKIWADCNIRYWLNAEFYSMAFTEGEKTAIKTTTVINADNQTYGTDGGSNTEDKVFLLSEDEVYGSNAVRYGFSSEDSSDKARQMKSSTYAKATGMHTVCYDGFLGNVYCWWLRSPGLNNRYAVFVSYDGSIMKSGSEGSFNCYYDGIVPALHLNLKTSNPIKACETITDIKLSTDTAIYTGDEVKPSVTIDGLTENEDYTVSYANNTEVGTATVTVTGIENCSGKITKTFEIKRDITQEEFALYPIEYTYSGKENRPTVISEKLIQNTDYTVTYESNVSAGTAKALITGTGEYTGTKEIEFTIKPQSIEDKGVNIETDNYVYDGNAKTPIITIEGLSEGQDFTVRYSNNLNAGEASATITGIGNYTGIIVKDFTITKKDISEMEIVLNPGYCIYDGTEKKPDVNIAGLNADTDYDVKYTDNKEIGTATVTATGKGNYSGVINTSFRIGKNISKLKVQLSADTYTYDGTEKRPVATIEGLEEGKDFVVGYVDNIDAGTATAYVISMGDYVGYISKTYTIKPYVFADKEEGITDGELHKSTILKQPDGDEKHLYFGSYPQTEIVAKASQCGTYGKEWATSSDYIIDEALYDALYNAEWDSNGDTIIDGSKYHRINKNDATVKRSYDIDSTYYWSDSTTYHYFKYEPIKWRILELTDNDIFLASEGVLDAQDYNTENADGNWEKSSMREWLSSSFYNMAFSKNEQSAITTTNVINGGYAGKNTTDNIFLLSKNEVCTKQYGFDSSDSSEDAQRQMKSSTYAKAMGTYTQHEEGNTGSCPWWLRTGGDSTSKSGEVRYNGSIRADWTWYAYGVLPALHINLENNNPITTCETITDISLSSNVLTYTGGELKPSVTIEELTENKDFTVSYSDNIEIGTAYVTVRGIGNCSGEITKTFEIIDGTRINLDVNEYRYDGTAHYPKMTIKDNNGKELVEGVDYDMAYSDNTDAGEAFAIAKLKGNYSGEIGEQFIINPKSIDKLTASLDSTLYVYDGAEKKPCVTIDGLTEGTDYIVTYQNNREAGIASATINGVGNYYGSITKEFRIGYLIKNIEDSVTLSATEYYCDGKEKTPEITINNLTKDIDYTVEYKNNVNAGTATVKITGIGKYIGVIEKTFTIKGYASLSGKIIGCSGNNIKIVLRNSDGKEMISTSGIYSFNSLMPGKYSIIVSADDDYVTREKTLTIENQTTCDIPLYRLGDANCDDKFTADDVTKIARHLARLSVEKDDYTLKLFNTDRSDDGKITAADATKLARYLANITSNL